MFADGGCDEWLVGQDMLDEELLRRVPEHIALHGVNFLKSSGSTMRPLAISAIASWALVPNGLERSHRRCRGIVAVVIRRLGGAVITASKGIAGLDDWVGGCARPGYGRARGGPSHHFASGVLFMSMSFRAVARAGLVGGTALLAVVMTVTSASAASAELSYSCDFG